jgi:hypothetical protein
MLVRHYYLTTQFDQEVTLALTPMQQQSILTELAAARNGHPTTAAALYRMEVRVQRGQAYHLDTARAAARRSLLDAKVPRNQLTDANLAWVLAQIGLVLAAPVAPAEVLPTAIGNAATAGLAELVANDAALGRALRMVFNNTAGGRSSPNNPAINHIHVGGHGNYNLIFNIQTYVALGTVGFHLDRDMNNAQQNAVATVEGRNGGGTTELWVKPNDTIIQV